MEFIVALVAYSITDDKMLAFTSRWLFSETLATVLYSIYNLHSPVSFSQDNLVCVLDERCIRLRESDSKFAESKRIYGHILHSFMKRNTESNIKLSTSDKQ